MLLMILWPSYLYYYYRMYALRVKGIRSMGSG
jgi:hypothetical protein